MRKPASSSSSGAWTDARLLAFMAALGSWSVLICAMTYAMQLPSMQNAVGISVMLVSFVAMLLLYWRMTRSRVMLGPMDRVAHCLMGLVVSTAFAMLMVMATYAGPLFVKYLSVKQYERELGTFERDTNQFTSIQRYAKQNFGVVLVLASAKDAWADTHLDIPGRSAASMHTGPGYCELHISPGAIEIDLGRRNQLLADGWVQGVQIHELAHCLDSRRDFADDRPGSTLAKSVAPEYKTQIHGMSDLIAAWTKPSSQRWREVFSDVAAVGFWQLHFPSQAADLIGALLDKRKAAQIAVPPDAVHDTACWVDVAAHRQAPSNDDDLLAWADSIRESSQCRL